MYIEHIGYIGIGYTGIAANIGNWTLDTGRWTLDILDILNIAWVAFDDRHLVMLVGGVYYIHFLISVEFQTPKRISDTIPPRLVLPPTSAYSWILQTIPAPEL